MEPNAPGDATEADGRRIPFGKMVEGPLVECDKHVQKLYSRFRTVEPLYFIFDGLRRCAVSSPCGRKQEDEAPWLCPAAC